MIEQDEIGKRKALLDADLQKMIKNYGGWAKRNYYAAYLIKFISVVASLAAGFGGLFTQYSGIFAVVALIPAAMLLFSANFKLQERANWHYRKKDAVNRLRNKLLFELPIPPTMECIAELSATLSQINDNLSKEWESSLGLEAASIEK